MSQKVLGLVHSVRGIVDGLHALCHEFMPDVETFDIVDDAARRIVFIDGGLAPRSIRRVCEDIVYCAECGADAVLVSCSSFTPSVDVARRLVDIPVLKIDEPMAKMAAQAGTRIGVIATAITALNPTSQLVQAQADALGKRIQIEKILCDEAYKYMIGGDLPTHDRIVLESLRGLLKRNDVVILAQASMARVADQLTPAERAIPVMSSPRSGIQAAAEVMKGM